MVKIRSKPDFYGQNGVGGTRCFAMKKRPKKNKKSGLKEALDSARQAGLSYGKWEALRYLAACKVSKNP